MAAKAREPPTIVPTEIPAFAPPDKPLLLCDDAAAVVPVVVAVDVAVVLDAVEVWPAIWDETTSGSSIETLKHGMSVVKELKGT